jgi:lipopolysaccharide/colanic/teichoic acid biosynthesis glycosyltransferase
MLYLFAITNKSAKNSTAQTLKNSTVKKLDQLEVIDFTTPHEFNILYVDHKIPLEQSINLIFKRIFDLITSSILLICLFSWMLPIIALAIKLDSDGPIFFIQKRNKKNGNVFSCIKFRTMIVNSNADILAATENDCRITWIGSILRKHHLDELPQLVNVLFGDMSLVGPRPYMVNDNEKYEKLIKNYLVRSKIKPGITGLAQVVDYINPITKIEYMEQRVSKDLYYIYNWSLLLDAKIMGHTFLKMLGLK